MADKCFDAQEMRENCVKETFVLLSFSIEKQEMEFEISECVGAKVWQMIDRDI